jgi:hypothetical protein
MRSRVRRQHVAILSTLLFCLSGIQAHAATITVTNTNDSGPGSLRQALADANDGDLINFAVAGTITLTSGGLVIDDNVTIAGPGAGQLSIDGNQTQMCVFGVAAARTVTISGLTISNGACGIFSDHSTLTVSNCVVTGNSSYGGVSINDVHGPATHVERRNSRRDAQKVYGHHPFAGNSLTIANSVVSDNAGPGVFNLSALVTILDSTISGNSTGQDWGDGGGIYSGGGKFPGYVIVNSSTISGNFALYSGGGIACGSSFLTIMNSTISGNSVGDPDYGDGGGVSASSMTIANSTVSGNSASICGGICGGTIEIGNTILSANASGNIDGTVTSRGYNISSDDGAGLLTGPGDQINTDPLLGPLRDHGGPTLTHMPMRGSPAIDAGDPSFTPPPDHDQRGTCFYRVFGPRIDVGSVETQLRPRCVTPAPRPHP